MKPTILIIGEPIPGLREKLAALGIAYAVLADAAKASSASLAAAIEKIPKFQDRPRFPPSPKTYGIALQKRKHPNRRYP